MKPSQAEAGLWRCWPHAEKPCPGASGLIPPQPVHRDVAGARNYTNRIFPTGGEHMKRKDHQDTCDHCGVPISGGDSWLGLCEGCEAAKAGRVPRESES